MSNAKGHPENAENDNQKMREMALLQRADEIDKVNRLKQRNRPTLNQIIFALKLGIDPEGLNGVQVSDAIDSLAIPGASKHRANYRYLLALYAYDADRVPLKEGANNTAIMKCIRARENELKTTFPVGSTISRPDGMIGVITEYSQEGILYYVRVQSQKRKHDISITTLQYCSLVSSELHDEIQQLDKLRSRVKALVREVFKDTTLDLWNLIPSLSKKVMKVIEADTELKNSDDDTLKQVIQDTFENRRKR